MGIKWFALIPGNEFALSFDFPARVTEADARLYAREYLGLNRLPNGTEVWCSGK